jgi:hypothetical protein
MILNFLRGNIRLVITYWIFGVIPAGIYKLMGILLVSNYLKLALNPYMRWVGVLYLIVPFVYFPFIYVAIWNSSNNYKKNKLWPILAKMAVIFGTVSLIVFAVQIYKQFTHINDLTYKLNQEVSLINKSVPLKINDTIEVEKVSFSNNTLSYEFRILNKNKTDVNSTLFCAQWKKNMIPKICKDGRVNKSLSAGVSLYYHIVDKNRADICGFTIKPSDCK